MDASISNGNSTANVGGGTFTGDTISNNGGTGLRVNVSNSSQTSPVTGGTFTGNSFSGNGGDGFYYSGYSVISSIARAIAPTISDNDFTGNGAWAAEIAADVLSSSLDTNTGSGNTYNAVGLSGTITQNWTWSPVGPPYVIEGRCGSYQCNQNGVVVASGATLMLPAGSVVVWPV